MFHAIYYYWLFTYYKSKTFHVHRGFPFGRQSVYCPLALIPPCALNAFFKFESYTK